METMERLEHITDTIENALYMQVSRGIESVNTIEFGKVADIYKDLLEAKKNCYEAKYYKSVSEAMEEEKEPSAQRGYKEPPYYHLNPARIEEMERYRKGYTEYGGNSGNNGSNISNNDNGARYYTDTDEMRKRAIRDAKEGRSGIARRGYMETKEVHKGDTATDKTAKMDALGEYLSDLGEDITEMVQDMTPQEKNVLKAKLTGMAQRIV